jgi:hypothetical protein
MIIYISHTYAKDSRRILKIDLFKVHYCKVRYRTGLNVTVNEIFISCPDRIVQFANFILDLNYIKIKLFKNEVRYIELDIPIDHGEGREIEGGMCDHKKPNTAGKREDRSENKAGDRRLLNTGDSLVIIMTEPEPGGCKKYDEYFRSGR